MKYKNFCQTISFECDDPEALVRLLEDWDVKQASSDIMGYIGTHLLADREKPGHYMIVAEFAVVDPDVPAVEEAERNNERPETQAWAATFRAAVRGEPVYHNYDELYRTG